LAASATLANMATSLIPQDVAPTDIAMSAKN
jgi:hypothetical protein